MGLKLGLAAAHHHPLRPCALAPLRLCALRLAPLRLCALRFAPYALLATALRSEQSLIEPCMSRAWAHDIAFPSGPHLCRLAATSNQKALLMWLRSKDMAWGANPLVNCPPWSETYKWAIDNGAPERNDEPPEDDDDDDDGAGGAGGGPPDDDEYGDDEEYEEDSDDEAYEDDVPCNCPNCQAMYGHHALGGGW